jgi:spore coat protein U-like protein
MRYAIPVRSTRLLLCGAILALFFAMFGSSANAVVCTVSIADMNFGAIDTLDGVPEDTVAEIAIQCDSIAPETSAVTLCGNIRAGSGGASSGIRQMQSGADVLLYQFYSDAARSIPWGAYDTPELGEPRTIRLPVSGTTASGTINLFGRVFADQPSAPTGSYLSSFSAGDVSFYYAEGESLNCATATGEGPAQSEFIVQAQVAANCLIIAEDLDFGQHGVIDQPVTASTQLSINCTPGSTYSISMDGGLSGATDPELRLMQSGINTIAYGLYSDATYSNPWGTTAGTLVSGTGAGSVSLPVYGRVLPQPAPPGTYTDTVVVTITYQ